MSVIGGASIQYSDSLALRLRLSALLAEGGEDGMGHCVADKYNDVVGRIRKRESEQHEHLRGEQGGSRSLVIVLREYRAWLEARSQVV